MTKTMEKIALLLTIYIAISSTVLVSAEISKTDVVPVALSLILLSIVYLWYRFYINKERLSEEVSITVRNVWILVLSLFLLSMAVRIPSVLLYGQPYEKIVMIYLTILTITLILNCKLSVFGFKSENFGKALTVGLIYYSIFEFSTRIVQFASAFFLTGQFCLVGYDPQPFLMTFPFMTFCVGISEEGLFRGFMQSLLQKFYSVRFAIFVQSLLFGVWHFVWHISPLDIFGMLMHILSSFVIGVLFGYFYSIAENLTPLILVHGLIDSFPSGYKFASLENLSASEAFMIWGLPYILSITLMFILTRKLAEWMKS